MEMTVATVKVNIKPGMKYILLVDLPEGIVLSSSILIMLFAAVNVLRTYKRQAVRTAKKPAGNFGNFCCPPLMPLAAVAGEIFLLTPVFQVKNNTIVMRLPKQEKLEFNTICSVSGIINRYI